MSGYATVVADAAYAAHNAGLAVVPPREDGSKAPAVNWRQYQTVPPTREQVEAWYADGRRSGLGVLCGQASGNLEMLEFERRAVDEGLWDLFVDQVDPTLLDRLYHEQSGGGGYHLLYRVARAPVPGNTKLARRPATDIELADNPDDRVKVLIETRGEGGYAVVAPSRGTVHPTGGAWTALAGTLGTLPTISADDQAHMHAVCAGYDQDPHAQPAVEPLPPNPQPPHQGTSAANRLLMGQPPAASGAGWVNAVIQDYNARTTWAGLLEAHGWTHSHRHGDVDHWTRPGKNTKAGHSATTNANGTDRLIVHSTSTPFETSPTSYDRFGAHAVLGHHGDRIDAARGLRCDGYGPAPPSTTSGATRSPGVSSLTSLSSQPHDLPVLDDSALYGLAGDVVRTLDPETEADPAGVLVSFLAAFGAILGSGPHAQANGARHPARIYPILVGATSGGRKGTAWSTTKLLLNDVDPDFMRNRVMGGFGSGEAVVDEVMDFEPKEGEQPRSVDKRLLVYEPELARLLRVGARDGSTLSPLLRAAWDGEQLAVRSRAKKAVANDAHITVVGHITADELRKHLAEVEVANGFANRFLYAVVSRSKLLPEGGNVTGAMLTPLVSHVRHALEEGRRTYLLTRDEPARELWRDLYYRMANDDRDGLVGAVTARAEAQVLRLSVIYALLDASSTIHVRHLQAAWAVWRYAEASARHIFGDALGDPIADRLYGAIRGAGDAGLDATEQHAALGRHVSARQLNEARASLVRRELIEEARQGTGGRPRTVCVVAKKAKEAKEALALAA